MEKVFKIKHPVYYLLTIFILFNCAGSPPAPIPEPVPEVVKALWSFSKSSRINFDTIY